MFNTLFGALIEAVVHLRNNYTPRPAHRKNGKPTKTFIITTTTVHDLEATHITHSYASAVRDAKKYTRVNWVHKVIITDTKGRIKWTWYRANFEESYV